MAFPALVLGLSSVKVGTLRLQITRNGLVLHFTRLGFSFRFKSVFNLTDDKLSAQQRRQLDKIYQARMRKALLRVEQEINTRMVPYIRGLTVVRTGKLRRSVRYNRNPETLVDSVFYGAYQGAQSPRELARMWMLLNQYRIFNIMQREVGTIII